MKSILNKILIFLIPILLHQGCKTAVKTDNLKPRTGGNIVKIEKSSGQYKLFINGRKTCIKGVGTGIAFGAKGQNYLRMARELGANAVRTWGIDQGTKKYLDEANRLGIYVSAGIWLNPVKKKVCSYITDHKYRNKVKKEALDYVRKFKDHPAIAFWNVGNEVFFFTRNEREKIAFAKFLNELIIEIKKIDKNHPVIYTSSFTHGLKYIVKYVPEVDIFGINLYGGISTSLFMCEHLKFNGKKLNKPIMITEVGQMGQWDRPKYKNGISIELPDHITAVIIKNRVKESMQYTKSVFGIFVFHLGETSQESLTWWNINYGKYKRAAYWEVYKIFKGIKNKIHYPLISSFDISKKDGLRPGEWMKVKTGILYKGDGVLSYEYFFSTSQENILKYYVNKRIEARVKGSGSNVLVQVPKKSGKYRFYVAVKNNSGSAAVRNIGIQVK
ncbi:MAG: hypothetical protein KAR07_06935 [Spirochaetes bacterium]|nr:hypothetical protein [Spirochaetota bacterium]